MVAGAAFQPQFEKMIRQLRILFFLNGEAVFNRAKC
jgi:hypothetical protein